MSENPEFTVDENLSYEQAIAQLEEIVSKLESGEPNLQEALELYQKGQSLARYCAMILEQAELKVRQLSEDQLNNKMG